MKTVLAPLLTLTAAVLTGCAAPRIADGLQRYGLNAEQSVCVGQSLAANLTTAQLMSLGRAASAYGRSDTSPGALTMSDLARVVAEIDDPMVPIEVGRAALKCRVLAAAD